MIETTLGPHQIKEITYPYLGTAHFDLVVLFTKPQTGVIVHRGHATNHPIGFYCDFWDEENFEWSDQKVTLQNI